MPIYYNMPYSVNWSGSLSAHARHACTLGCPKKVGPRGCLKTVRSTLNPILLLFYGFLMRRYRCNPHPLIIIPHAEKTPTCRFLNWNTLFWPQIRKGHAKILVQILGHHRHHPHPHSTTLLEMCFSIFFGQMLDSCFLEFLFISFSVVRLCLIELMVISLTGTVYNIPWNFWHPGKL